MRQKNLLLFLVWLLPLNSFASMINNKDNHDLEHTFKNILHQYDPDTSKVNTLWREVVTNYSGNERHYHTMQHLQNFYNQLQKCKDLIKDNGVLIIAMVYHDVIYKSIDHKDEERSAVLAVERLRNIGYPADKIEKCKALILATETHAESTDSDTNYFNDADMSILGLDRTIYTAYIKNIRLEYSDTPQFDAGRKKVLQYFLSMKRIFKTDFFYSLYEKSARANIQWEVDTLP